MELWKGILVFLIVFKRAQTDPYTIEELDPKKGIILESIGVGVTYEKTWTAVTSIKLPDWEPVLEYLQYCDQTLLEVCSIRGEKAETRCRYWDKIIKRDIAEIREQVAEFNGFSSTVNKGSNKQLHKIIIRELRENRKRRGLVDVVGKVSKFLFETMDHEDSEEIYKKLQQLEHNSEENLQLISKQMTLIRSNFDAVLAPIKTIQKEHAELKGIVGQFINEYTQNMHKLDKELQNIRVQGETSEIMLAVLTHMQFTQKTLNQLFTLINSLQQHKLHPLLLRADTLEKLYKNITTSVTLNERFRNPAIINEITRIEYLVLTDQILIKILIPVGKELEYKINKVYKYPVPVEHGNFAVLNTKADFLMINNNKQIIRPLTKEEFSHRCTRLHIYSAEATYLCKEEEPIPIGTQTPDPCFQHLIFSKNVSTPHCAANIMAYHPDLLIKMNAPNTWLFSYHTEQLLQSHCNNGNQQTTVGGSGVIRANPNCSITIGPWELPIETSQITKLTSNQLNITIPKLIYNIRPLPNITAHVEPSRTIKDPQGKNLENAVQQTAELANEIHQTELRRLREKQGHQMWTNLGMSTVTTIGLLGILAYICIKARKRGNIQSREEITPRAITISAPIINPLPRIESQSSLEIEKVQNQKKQVTFRESEYMEPPQEVAPPPPSSPALNFHRNPSIRIPYHSSRS